MRSLLVVLISFLLAGAGHAFAQEALSLRLGDHGEYTRLVFDWKGRPGYTISKDAGHVLIRFDKNASPGAPPTADGNIQGVKIISESPLQVDLSIPADSRTRDFFAGERVVVDVYNPPGGRKVAAAPPPTPEPALKSEPEATPVPKPEPAAVAEKTPEPLPTPAPEKAPPPPTETAHAEEPAPAETPAEPEEEDLQDVAAAQKTEKPNLISLTSTKALGMAVFELRDELWIVGDLPESLLSPRASGPQAEHFKPIESLEIEGGRAFKTRTLEGAQTRVQGGGLIWRVMIAASLKPRPALKAVRIGVDESAARSGKILWPLAAPGKMLKVTDSVTGVPVIVVTAQDAKQYAGPAMEFVDFRILNSPAGLAVIPKVDDLKVEITDKGVEISRPGGLALTPESAVVSALSAVERKKSRADKEPERRIFDFKNWQLGGVKALAQNNAIIMAGLRDLSDTAKADGIMTLAKMHLANGQGAEALGYMEYVGEQLPALTENTQFLAMRGAAKALAWKTEDAFSDLAEEGLDPFAEIGYWKAFVLADLGDWIQAADTLPPNIDTLLDYPETVFNRLAPVLAEVALRAANVKQADDILDALEVNEKTLFESQKAAMQYLKGESARQRNDIAETLKLWEPLTKGKDKLYRAKAGLAITRLQMDQKKINQEKAIDNLERLRYAWRGDELEAQINYWLGLTYFEGGDYARGLNIMREAAALSAGTELGKRVTADMTAMFSELFLGPKLDEISPLDAAALYEQFAELLPVGPEGDKVVQKLAERLVDGDLLGRAGDLLVTQLEHRLTGVEAYDIATRLAAIYLLDSNAKKAMGVLDKATEKLKALPEAEQTPARFREISLLRARALSRMGRPDQALALLNGMDKTPDANSLRADIAWNAGYWDDAAEALEDVIIDRNISLTRPLEDENANLLLNRGVALNLATDRVALANMREKYSDAMAQTDKARVFEVITRPRQSAALADRDTLMGIVSEVDLFSDFLKSYKTVAPPASN